mgnify:CR=1 FL=1
MKTFFIEARSQTKISKGLLDKLELPKKIALVSTIQQSHTLNEIKDYLEDKGYSIVIGGQVIGCNVINAFKVKEEVEAILYIGSGEFHPIEIARKTRKKVIKLNPYTKVISEISEKEINDYEKKIRGKLSKFYNAKKIGIIVSLKPGQQLLWRAEKFVNDHKDKECFIFVTNDVRKEELENFNDVDYWVNTACSRIEMNGVISIDDIENNKKA